MQLEAQSEKNMLFNKGYLTKFNLKNLFCPCGTKIDQDKAGSGMCVACGTATCSSECHDKYMVSDHKCTFHKNFSVEMQEKSMRSIIFKNIDYFISQGYSNYTSVNRTSPNFIVGYLGEQKEELYLQRGFRQYGNPLPETLDNMEVINQKNLDYVLHISRACDCNCSCCQGKDIHPVYNCEVDCKQKEAILHSDLSLDERMQEICECKCEFCNSGVTVLKHRRLDCAFYCHNSSLGLNFSK